MCGESGDDASQTRNMKGAHAVVAERRRRPHLQIFHHFDRIVALLEFIIKGKKLPVSCFPNFVCFISRFISVM